MSEKIEPTPAQLGPLPDESMKDYASRRLVELQNSKRNFVDKANFLRGQLQKAEADIIACDARIAEMQRIIQSEALPSSNKS